MARLHYQKLGRIDGDGGIGSDYFFRSVREKAEGVLIENDLLALDCFRTAVFINLYGLRLLQLQVFGNVYGSQGVFSFGVWCLQI